MAIKDFGRIEALNRKDRTTKQVSHAMKEIEAEIDSNGGVYPFNDGRLSQQEVLRRARLSSSALQKATHRDLRLEVNSWIRLVLRKSISGAKSVRRAVTDRLDAANEDLNQIMQKWTEAELEYIEAKETIAGQQAAISALEQEVKRLQRLVGSDVVVSFPKKESTPDDRSV